MNTNLTLDQRVNRGIKKIKELYPGEELVVLTIELSRQLEFDSVGISSVSDIDKISILMSHLGTPDHFVKCVESSTKGVFYSPIVKPPSSLNPISKRVTTLWPMHYSLDSYIEKLFLTTGITFAYITTTNDATTIFDSDVAINPFDYCLVAKNIIQTEDNIAINLQTQAIHRNHI